VCKIDATTLTGPGWVHRFSGVGAVPKSRITFDQCALAPTCS